jgi:lysophospholipase L1-like esterase
MRLRRVLGRLLLAILSSLLWLGLIDAWMRTRVGVCGLTPFRNSAIEALPHELVPGRITIYKGVDVRINQAGFRGPEWPAPPPGAERIALIGDSVTFGNGCPETETLAASLERELAGRGHPAQVLNCGVPAYNAPNVLTMLRERVIALAPQRVIYVMVANDVTKAQKKFAIPADAEIDPFSDFPLGSPLLQFLNTRTSALLRVFGFHLGGYVEAVLAQCEQGGGERVAAALAELQRLCREQGIAFAVAIYPYMVRVDHSPFRPIEDDCARRCAALAIPCIRVSDAFASDEDLTKYWVAPLDGHPNGVANHAAAALIAERLLAH